MFISEFICYVWVYILDLFMDTSYFYFWTASYCFGVHFVFNYAHFVIIYANFVFLCPLLGYPSLRWCHRSESTSWYQFFGKTCYRCHRLPRRWYGRDNISICVSELMYYSVICEWILNPDFHKMKLWLCSWASRFFS